MDRRSRSLVDWSPVDSERIEKSLSKRETVTANDVREFLGATQRGMGTIEYLVFGNDTLGISDLVRGVSPASDAATARAIPTKT